MLGDNKMLNDVEKASILVLIQESEKLLDCNSKNISTQVSHVIKDSRKRHCIKKSIELPSINPKKSSLLRSRNRLKRSLFISPKANCPVIYEAVLNRSHSFFAPGRVLRTPNKSKEKIHVWYEGLQINLNYHMVTFRMKSEAS